MRTGKLAHCMLGCMLLSWLASCEYEWKEEQAISPGQSEASHQESPQERVAVPAAKKQPSDVRPVLAPGKEIAGMAVIPKGARQLNLPELAENGLLKVSTNDPTSQDLKNAYDEVETTLARSTEINPFVFTFEFSEPHSLKAARVLSGYSDYGWAIQIDGQERLVVRSVIDGEWSTIAWPEGIKGKKVTVEVLRIARDNYVHVHEIAFYE